jgi:hypothetical protein
MVVKRQFAGVADKPGMGRSGGRAGSYQVTRQLRLVVPEAADRSL